jgi:cobalt-precorrin 5A hydrolase
MVGGQTVTEYVAIGVGCRTGASAEAVEALIRQALAQVPQARRLGVFTIQDKGAEPGLIEAACRFGLELIPLAGARLRLQAPFVETRSARVEKLFGVGSVAEAAALAGAGADARLVVPRIAGGGVTCAIARSGGDPA